MAIRLESLPKWLLKSVASLGLMAAASSAVNADEVITDNVTLQTTDTPRLRFWQTPDNYPEQKWDIGGWEQYFYVYDLTADKTIVRIATGAPGDSLYVGKTGNIGLGTPTPTALLHGVRAAQAGNEILARFEVADDNGGRLDISNASSTNGVFIPRIQGRAISLNAALIMEGLISGDSGTGPAIVYNAARNAGGSLVNRPLVVYRNNDVAKVTVAANGDVYGTSFNPVSSRALKRDIVDLDSLKASSALKELTPVEYTYNDDPSGEKRVGFIAEDVPEIVANADRKSVPIMDVVALLTRVVKDQQQTIDEQRKTIDDQKKSMEDVLRRLTIVEKQMTR